MVNNEKLVLARYFSWLSIFIFGWASYIDFKNAYHLIATINLAVAVLGPCCYLISTIFKNDKLLIGYALSVTFINLVAIATTQLDSADNLLWVPLFPLVFLFFSNLIVGISLSLAGVIVLSWQYFNLGLWGGAESISMDVFLQLITAYSAAMILGVLYEHSRRQKETVLQKEADIDALTQIPNRRAFDRYFSSLIKIAQLELNEFSLILFDIDNFKTINDKNGHIFGDLVLSRIAAVTKQSMREKDFIARWGGEEFVLVLPHTKENGAVILAEKLCAVIRDMAFPELNSLSASFGVTEYCIGDKCDEIIARADFALYEAKTSGKNRVTVCCSVPERATDENRKNYSEVGTRTKKKYG